MPHDDGTTRRRFLQNAALLAGASAFGTPGELFAGLNTFAQDPPAGCPTQPTGGIAFVPGSDTRPIVLRKSIASLTSTEVSTLQNAYAALRALPASDKRTWVLQADLHALYCDSCTNSTMDIHGSWNFFPWHRAYIYYYERILGSLVGDIDHFRLPYWDWTTDRTLPGSYMTPSGAGNSLWNTNRNSGMAGGGNLPPLDGTAARITTLNSLSDFASFGGDASSGGAMEGNPHGTIHMDVGQTSPPFHDMGNLGFAARDPLFFAHHGNIDRVWSMWNELSAGTGLPPGAYKNPTNAAFLNARWSFYDENQQLVSISAANVLDHRNQLRYTYRRIFRIPPRYFIWVCKLICCRPGPDPDPFIRIDDRARENILSASRARTPITLILKGVQVPMESIGNFDIVAVTGEKRTIVGSIGIIAHGGGRRMNERRPMTVALDISEVAAAIVAKENPATLKVVPRNRDQKGFVLQARAAEIRTQRR